MEKQIEFKKYCEVGKKSLPENVQKTLEKFRNVILHEQIDNLKIKEIRSQGSMKDNTGNTYFRFIKKHDLDLICILDGIEEIVDLRNINSSNKLESVLTEVLEKRTLDSRLGKWYYSYPKNLEQVDENVILNFKNELYKRLEEKYGKQYDIEQGSKTIKVLYSNGDDNYVLEFTVGVELEIMCNKNVIDDMFDEAFLKKLKKLNALKEYSSYYVLKGQTIIGEDSWGDVIEVPNFYKYNLASLKLTNQQTKGNFQEYVRWFKNFINVYNENHAKNPIKISSFHIENCLWLVSDEKIMSKKISLENVKGVIDEIINTIYDEDDFNSCLEMNELLNMRRNWSFQEFENEMAKLKNAVNNQKF